MANTITKSWRVMVNAPEGHVLIDNAWCRRYLSVTWSIHETKAEADAEAARFPGSFVVSEEQYQRMPSFTVG